MTEIDTGTDHLLCRVEEGVAVITFNRPDARNALGDQLTPALRRMIRERGEDPDVRCLLLTGSGTAFCAGGDVKGMGDNLANREMTEDERIADLQERQRDLSAALIALRIPTIAALPGVAAGGGMAIALACDIRLAAQSAFLTTAYARIGLSGDYGMSWLLTRLVGTSRARELMFTSERVDAERCERIGLVNRVVPDADLQAEAFNFARSLAEGPSIAFGRIKDNLDEALTNDFLTSLDGEAVRVIQSFSTEDHQEAVRAFVEKRKADFRGK
jgi:enoyl-CoA hydratase/carnithine racemase